MVNSSSVALQENWYYYDKAGNIVKVEDKVRARVKTYVYDDQNRLISSNENSEAAAYEYNKIGNITKKGNLVYTYGQNGAGPHAVTAISDGSSMTYDLNGNMTTMATAAKTQYFTYDGSNRLVKVEQKLAGASTKTTVGLYAYDGDGGRVKKTVYKDVSGVPTPVVSYYVGSLFEETAGVKTDHIFMGASRVATYDGSKVRWLIGDHLGSTSTVLNETAVMVERIDYNAWGELKNYEKFGAGSEVAWFYFTGKKVDEESGLVFFGGRYYVPKIARWLTVDPTIAHPYDPQDLNRYTYCRNNPVNLVDPTGYSWFKKTFGGKSGTVAAIIGAVVGIVATIALGPAGAMWYGLTMSGVIGGALGGAVSGGLTGGWQGAATGAVIGGVVGGIGGYMAGGSAASSGGNQVAMRSVEVTMIDVGGGSALGQAAVNASAAGAGGASAFGSALSGAVAGAAGAVGAAAASASSAANYWAYESVVPGPFGQPVSEWRNGAPNSWGDPMKYTEQAGGAWMWAERVAMGISAGATIGAIAYDAALPYWRYTGPGSNPNSNWLTRGWKPPYGNDFEAARNALQVRDQINAVERVNVPVYRPVAGPRPSVLHPEYGKGGGAEWYRGIRFPQETGGY